MSRFADVTATERLVLGECKCLDTPHSEDYIDVRTQLGAEDALVIAAAAQAGSSLDALEVLVVGWNMLDIDGSVAPVDRAHLSRLFTDTFDVLEGFIEKHVRLTSLPNESAARSQRSSRPSGSPTRRLKKVA